MVRRLYTQAKLLEAASVPLMSSITLIVNRQRHTVDVDPATPLLYVLSDDLGLRGPKFGCGLGQCGACTVISGGRAIRSCVTPVSAVGDAEILYFCTGHGVYKNGLKDILRQAPQATGVVDGANLYHHADFAGGKVGYTGIGRGRKPAPAGFVEFVEASFRAMERGTANEVQGVLDFLNGRYASSEFNKVQLDTVRKLGATCVTGCEIAATGKVAAAPAFNGFTTHLAACAAAAK